MKLFTMAGLFLGLACLSPAQIKGALPVNAKIYVDAPADFESALAATIASRHLPVTVTTEKRGADYQLQALSGANVIASADWTVRWLHGYGEAAIRVVDLHSGDTVFFAPLDRNSAMRDWGTAAEACAGRLRAAVNRAADSRTPPHPILDF